MVHNLVQLPFTQPAVAETSDRLVALSLSTAAAGQRPYPLHNGHGDELSQMTALGRKLSMSVPSSWPDSIMIPPAFVLDYISPPYGCRDPRPTAPASRHPAPLDRSPGAPPASQYPQVDSSTPNRAAASRIDHP